MGSGNNIQQTNACMEISQKSVWKSENIVHASVEKNPEIWFCGITWTEWEGHGGGRAAYTDNQK